MAKAPTNERARAIAALLRGSITPEEYRACCLGISFIRGVKFWDGTNFTEGWTVRRLLPTKETDRDD